MRSAACCPSQQRDKAQKGQNKTTTPACIEQLNLKNEGTYLLLWRWTHIPVVYLTTLSVTLLEDDSECRIRQDVEVGGRVIIGGKFSACARKKVMKNKKYLRIDDSQPRIETGTFQTQGRRVSTRNVKVKVTLEQAMKAQTGSSIALLFL